MRNDDRTGVRRRIGMAWIILTTTTSVVRWGTTTKMATAATAFSLASIFPRKTEKVRKDRDDVLPVCYDTETEKPFLKGHALIPESMRDSSQQKLPFPIISDDGDGITHSSVHLQLQSMHQATSRTQTLEEPNVSPPRPPQAEQPKVTQVRVHEFTDPTTNKTWVALNTPKRKFLAYLESTNVLSGSTTTAQRIITTSTISLPEQVSRTKVNGEAECSIRDRWRSLWQEQQVITERTELLAVYQSDNLNDENSNANGESEKGDQRKSRRGGFRDLLNLYASRLVAILHDEQHDERTPTAVRYRSSLVRAQQRNRCGQSLRDDETVLQNDYRILVKWLEDNYGMSETQMLQARRFRSLPVPAQLELMHHFLAWFRKHFPYYYDRCDTCGSSQKEEMASHPPQGAGDNNVIHGEDDDDDNSTFLGYIYPDPYEIKGKASRTELYHCHKCRSFTRFPRYNSAFDIIQSRRGRCGEYSLLLYRFLRALNHDARWVVDWADHVWAEVLIGDKNNNAGSVAVGGAKSGIIDPAKSAQRWVHLDPCEAAVDKPLLYEEWGKKQTYIIALYAPLRCQVLQEQGRSNDLFLGHRSRLPLLAATGVGVVDQAPSFVEDVTQQYTNDSWESICKRREESDDEVVSAIQDAIQDLERKLFH